MSQRTSHAQECPKTTEELLDLLIREGIASVERNETLAERIRAAKAGFELCRLLPRPFISTSSSRSAISKSASTVKRLTR